jgi:hypothetical protein
MKKERKTAIILALFFSLHSAISYGAEKGYWQKFKESIYSYAYMVWNIPILYKLFLSSYEAAVLDQELIGYNDGEIREAYVYNTTHDNLELTVLRKQLHLSGVYFSDGTDVKQFYKTEFLQTVENKPGFIKEKDNTTSACLLRLLEYKAHFLPSNPENYFSKESLMDLLVVSHLMKEIELTIPYAIGDREPFNAVIQHMKAIIETSSSSINLTTLLKVWQQWTVLFKENKEFAATISENL